MMTMRLAVALLATGCVTEELATRESNIIGGTRSLGVEATVMLAGFPSDRSVLHTCTAVVVSPTVLLTSAHCVDEPNHPDYLYGVFTGDDASPYPNLAALEPALKTVKSVHPHPQYSPNLPFYADIAVVVMNAPLANAPIAMQRGPLDSTVVGKPARIVGYGQITYGQYNSTRYEAMTTVQSMENDTVVVGDSQKRACLGDSGGPAIVEGTLIGIDSYGPVGCDAAAHYRRVDSFMAFITPYVPEPTPMPDPDPDPDPEDDDDGDDDSGCSTGGGSGGLALVLAFGWIVSRRKRR